jgi:beta-galactosidase
MVQVENEYGIISRTDFSYLKAAYQIFKDVGFECQLFTCDPGSTVEWSNPAFRIPGALIGRNGLRTDRDAQATIAANGDFPVYSSETYTGWFSGWGGKIDHRTPIPTQMRLANYFLDHQYSSCLYMFFGGTNWGFYNGCNEYLPVQTSYDYDAPVDEAGRVTDGYRQLRDLYATRTGRTLPEIPPDPKVVALPAIQFDQKEPLLEWLPSTPTLTSAKPVSMEDLDQAYGYVLYRKTFPQGIQGKLELKQAMDYTIVMINGKTVGKSFVGYGADSNTISLNATGPATLDLLVHNLGRISVLLSSNSQSLARKGLIGGAFLDGKELTDWEIYSLPMNSVDNFKASSSPHTGPTFYHATFTIDQPASTFLDMRNWGFGAVWVNGHNLGRYWDRGALRSLFLPSEFLKPGENEITILELHDAPKNPQVSGVTKIIEEPAVPFVVRLDQLNLPPQAGGVK